jgi:primosomal protein N' (replication factor Y)
MLKRKKQPTCWWPEICPHAADAPDILSHFGTRLPCCTALLAIGERYDEWKRIRAGKARVVIGTRSAVFAPVSDLGLVILDEEQESSIKSENSPRNHARDVAKVPLRRKSGPSSSGLRHPGISTAASGPRPGLQLLHLPGRYNEQALPRGRSWT